MPQTVHHFTPVWPLHEPQQSFRSKRYAPPKKRKRLPESDSDDTDDTDSNAPPAPASVASHDITDPYRVAGWLEHLPLPSPSFPHGPSTKPPKLLSGSNDLQKELASLKPPLYVPPADEEDQVAHIRKHHLNVLTTIMHTSLMKADFVRAGRAWGMILRTDVQGSPFDLRTHGRWGIGAEVLLRCSAAVNSDKESPINDVDFEAAKDYYERLILQYPYQKTNPHAISSLNFYPAMFGLYIYEIQGRCKQALQRMQTSSPDPDDSDLNEAHNHGDELADSAAIKRYELGSGVSLAGRMDDLMLSPPFDTHPPLLQLRGAVALWLADLYDSVAESDDEDNDEIERASMERAKAKRCMTRLEDAGVEVPEMITAVLN